MNRNQRSDIQPRTLRITAAPWGDFQEAMVGTGAESGANGDRLVAFEDAGAIQRLLTPKRLELIKAVMQDPPESMRQLAARLERPPSEVHGDVHLLAEYGIVEIETVGRAKRPWVPYEAIEIEVTLSLPDDSDDTVTAT